MFSEDCPYAFRRPFRIVILRSGSLSDSMVSHSSSHRYLRSLSLYLPSSTSDLHNM